MLAAMTSRATAAARPAAPRSRAPARLQAPTAPCPASRTASRRRLRRPRGCRDARRPRWSPGSAHSSAWRSWMMNGCGPHGLSGAHVVLALHFQHRRPHQARRDSHEERGQREGRQDQVFGPVFHEGQSPQGWPRSSCCRRWAAIPASPRTARSPSGRPEARHGVEQQHDDGQQAVGPAADPTPPSPKPTMMPSSGASDSAVAISSTVLGGRVMIMSRTGML